MRHRTIHFRAENLNMAEQEVGNKVTFRWSRCDSAAEHDYSRCASARCLPISPALSVLDVPASQASTGVDMRPRYACSLPSAHALNVLPGVLRRRLQCLLSSPVCCFIGWEAGDVHGPAFSSASRADAVRLAMQSTFAVLARVWHIGVVMCVCGSGAWLARSERARGLCPGAF